MILKLYSIANDLLELPLSTFPRPNIKIVEIYFDNNWHPWHGVWEPLKITDFKEDFETVKNKIIEYYKAETLNCAIEGAVRRLPGYAMLLVPTYGEEWRLNNCKISDCNIDEKNKSVTIELSFDGVDYKNGCK
jgi:hypothetical protein